MLPMDFCNTYPLHRRYERAMQLARAYAQACHKLPSAASSGQQQRMAIARANDPPIIVTDEPTSNLDSKTAN